MRSIPGTSIVSQLDNEFGHVMVGTIANVSGGIPTTASTFGVGCRLTDRSTGKQYVNRGTITAPVWLQDPQFITTCTTTNGTTPVNIFSSAGAPTALTITGVFVIARDTTAGNITPKQGTNTVCTIAKGTVSGVAVGGASLSNTTYAAGDVATVVSSSAGNADAFITWQLA